jgi:hypothetical protein
MRLTCRHAPRRHGPPPPLCVYFPTRPRFFYSYFLFFFLLSLTSELAKLWRISLLCEGPPCLRLAIKRCEEGAGKKIYEHVVARRPRGPPRRCSTEIHARGAGFFSFQTKKPASCEEVCFFLCCDRFDRRPPAKWLRGQKRSADLRKTRSSSPLRRPSPPPSFPTPGALRKRVSFF